MAQRKFLSYKSLESALRRDDFAKPGVLATTLLSVFLLNDSELRASTCIAKELCAEGKFTNLRRLLLEKNWLVWSELQINKAKYHPGRKLIKFVNIEKIGTSTLVTTEQIIPKQELQAELNSTKVRLCRVEQRLAKIEKVTAALLEVVGPPDTPTRVNKRLALAAQLQQETKQH